MAIRHVTRGEELVADQRRRLACFEQHGSAADIANAAELLLIFEQSLALHRDSLKRIRSDLRARRS